VFGKIVDKEGNPMSREKGWTLKSALDRAILMEEQSNALYSSAIKKALSPGSKTLLGNLANDELQHKSKLERIKQTGSIEQLGFKAKAVIDLQILDQVEDVRLSEDVTYQEILVFAGKREKESHDYYAEFSTRLEGTPAGDIFRRLAEEEMDHKNKIEKEYESVVMKEG
jgi:rubrerythrin